MRLSANRLFGFSGLTLLGLMSGQEESQGEALRRFLLERSPLVEADLAAVDDGQIITQVLGGEDKRAMAVLGVVRLAVPGDFSGELLSDPELLVLSSLGPEFGTFSDPPRIEDVEDLDFPRQDIEALRTCRVGACDVKLPAAVIERFRREIDWESDEGAANAAALAREMLVDYVASYRAAGNAALGAYADKEEVLSIAEGFELLLEDAKPLAELVPSLHAYLINYPRQRPDRAEDLVYWVRENFGIKSVVSLYHMIVYRTGADLASPVVIASKQLYASHYFQAVLNVMAVFDASGERGQPSSYLISVQSARFDGELGGFKRIIVRSRLNREVAGDLESLRDRLEASYRASLTAEAGSR